MSAVEAVPDGHEPVTLADKVASFRRKPTFKRVSKA